MISQNHHFYSDCLGVLYPFLKYVKILQYFLTARGFL